MFYDLSQQTATEFLQYQIFNYLVKNQFRSPRYGTYLVFRSNPSSLSMDEMNTFRSLSTSSFLLWETVFDKCQRHMEQPIIMIRIKIGYCYYVERDSIDELFKDCMNLIKLGEKQHHHLVFAHQLQKMDGFLQEQESHVIFHPLFTHYSAIPSFDWMNSHQYLASIFMQF